MKTHWFAFETHKLAWHHLCIVCRSKTDSNFDTEPLKSVETERQRQWVQVHSFSWFLHNFLLFDHLHCTFFALCRWLSSPRLIEEHRSTSCFTISNTHTQSQTQARAELMLTLLGDKDKSEHLIRALCFYPLLSRVRTHTYCTFLPLFSLQSHNERFHPRTPPLCPCLIPEAQHTPLTLSSLLF